MAVNDWRLWLGMLLVVTLAAVVGATNTSAAARARRAGANPDRAAAPRSTSAPTGDAASVAAMQNGFALDLYRRLGTDAKGGNLFYSPYSVYAALAMTAEGARGETAEQMGRALHLAASLRRQGPDARTRPWDFERVHVGLAALAAGLERGAGAATPAQRARIVALRAELAKANEAAHAAQLASKWDDAQRRQAEAGRLADELNTLLPTVDRYELRIANALWGEATYPFDPRFVQALAAHYGSGGVRSVDFRAHAEDARRQINAWAAENTEQRIRDLLAPGVVDASTRLVLTNAIYFKGEWSEVFTAGDTKDAPFHIAGGGSANVPLMHGDLEGASYGAFRADGSVFPTPREIPPGIRNGVDDARRYPGPGGCQLVELPYKGGALSMVVLVPSTPDGLGALERTLTAERLARWLEGLETRRVEMLLPRFRLELGCSLGGPLQAMGMTRAFVDPARGPGAQFGGMTAGADPRHALFVGAVVHKAFLDVNERGTEAAAATAVVMGATAVMQRMRPFVPVVRADRPFLFLIRDVHTGNILFMGRLARP